MPLSEKDLWKKLENYCLSGYTNEGSYENLDVLQEQIMERSAELAFFNQNISRSLSLYSLISNITEEIGYINVNYRFYCEISLIGIITSLESYLENNFRKISNNIKIDNLDLRKISDFIREYNLEKRYFAALKSNGTHDFLLSEITS